MLMVMTEEIDVKKLKFNFFKNFKNLLMGGHDEKLKNFENNGTNRKKNH